MSGRNTIALSLSLLITWNVTLEARAQQEVVRVHSPDGAVELVITSPPVDTTGNPWARYRVGYRGQPVIVDSTLGLNLDAQPPLQSRWKQVGVHASEGNDTYRVPVGKSNPIRDHFRAARGFR